MSQSAQQAFLSALIDPDQPVPADISHPIAGHAVDERFNIYRNNVVYSLRTALADKFPYLNKLIGGAAFTALADSYVRSHLPQTPLLQNYGDDLPEHLAAFAPLADVPYAADLARLEVKWLMCYHAADHVALLPSRLLTDAVEQYGLSLAASLQLLASDWPLYDLWQFVHDEGPAPEQMQAQQVLVYRDQNFTPQVIELPDGGADFIERLQAGDRLATAVENAAESAAALSPEGLQRIMTLLVHEGQICGLN